MHSQEDEENMHASTRKTISMVREQIHAVSDTYQSLMTTCQQKRNLFIVCVKFHMSIRQVRRLDLFLSFERMSYLSPSRFLNKKEPRCLFEV